MVRLKIAYWEFDFEAVCPTLDHDLLSQAHIYNSVTLSGSGSVQLSTVAMTHTQSSLLNNMTLKYSLTASIPQQPKISGRHQMCQQQLIFMAYLKNMHFQDSFRGTI